MSSDQFLDKIHRFRFNPVAVQTEVLKYLEELTGGQRYVVNASNPFVFLTEMGAYLSAAGMIENEALNRKQYPSVAMNLEDLYLHMSDIDYLNVFATPGQTMFNFLIGKEELLQKAVRVGQTDTRKLVIPRHTRITIADTVFTLQYPIEIRVLSHGGINIAFDGSRPSPLMALDTNIIDWQVGNVNGLEVIRMQVPVQQMRLASNVSAVNDATGFKQSYSFQNQFYYARVFNRADNGEWEEIRTTHTEQVYDPSIMTAALRLVNGTLWVTIPQIYFTQGIVGSQVRVDIYTTKGDIEMSLDNFEIGTFNAEWIDNDKEDNGIYSAPLDTFGVVAVYSDQKLSGGTNGLSFREIRERVLTNSLGQINLPITNTQMVSSLRNNGFDLVTNLDSVTNRQFLATREMIAPPDDVGVAPANATTLMLQSTMDELANKQTVKDNGNRITLMPETLYKSTNGVLSVVPKATVDTMLASTKEALAADVNANSYLYTPYFYVLDINSDEFNTRVYDLNSPEIVSKNFVKENETSLIQVSVDNYDIYPTGNGDGFYLDMATTSNNVFKEIDPVNVRIQVSFIPPGQSKRVFMTTDPNDTVILDNDELLFRLHITTEYDITELHRLILTSFKVLDNSPRELPVELDWDLDVAFVITNHEPPGLLYTINDVINSIYLPAIGGGITNHVAVAHERVKIHIGDHLERLWTRSRSVIGPEAFETYATDVQAFHETDVYVRDEVTGEIVYTWNAGTSDLEYEVLYYAGDPVVNEAGETAYLAAVDATPGLLFSTWWDSLDSATQDSYMVYAHLAGDVKYDSSGDPIPLVQPREVIRQTDLFLIDGKYYFATAPESEDYRVELTEFVTNWVVNDIENIASKLLEQSEMFFYPRSTVGTISAYTGENVKTSMKAEQELVVTYHVNADVFANGEVRDVIATTTARVIQERLSRTTVSLDDILSNLAETLGEDIISVKVTGLFSDVDVDTATLVDNSAKFVIGKRLTVLADQSLVVEDAVTVNFIRHTS